MKRRWIPAAIAVALIPLPGAAQTAPLRVLASNGVKAAIEELQPRIERAAGRPLAIEWGTTAALRQKAASGEAFDVAVLTTEAIADLVKSGALAPDTRADLARSGIGVGVRAGAAKPGLRTAESVRQALRDARSITYAGDGASRPFLEAMFARFGIAESVKAKTTLTAGSGAATANVAEGRAELVFTLVSEIVGVRGVDLAGALPAELQNYVSFAGAVGAKSAGAAGGRAMLKVLTGPDAAPVYRAKGMEPR